MKKWWEYVVEAVLYVVLVIGLVLVVARLMASKYEIGYEQGVCEAMGGTYVARGFKINGEMVHCIETPKAVEAKEP